MTNTHDPAPLSRIEIVVLARLDLKASTAPAKLREAVAELLPGGNADVLAAEVLASLCRRGLAVKGRGQRRTEAGNRALCAALELAKAPSWKEARDTHLPARGLVTLHGGEAPRTPLGNKEAISVAIVRAHHKLPATKAATATSLCDALIAEKLGIPLPARPLSMGYLRTHVLAQRTNTRPGQAPGTYVDWLAFDALGATAPGTKRRYRAVLTAALAQRWLREHEPPHHQAAPTLTSPPVERERLEPPPPPPAPPPEPVPLLELVRSAIPSIGADGRFGTEKVFVSALWHKLERERRPPDLSLESFKSWLVSANRQGQLVLARADLVAALDSRLVAESEIRDHGSTFHFVLDRRTHGSSNGARRTSHAR